MFGGTSGNERPDNRVVCGLEWMVRPFRTSGMDADTLFGQALEFGTQWKVLKSEMDVSQRRLCLALDVPPGTKLACPRCGQLCAVHDTAENEWQHRTKLRARVPPVKCEKNGMLQAEAL